MLLLCVGTYTLIIFSGHVGKLLCLQVQVIRAHHISLIKITVIMNPTESTLITLENFAI